MRFFKQTASLLLLGLAFVKADISATVDNGYSGTLTVFTSTDNTNWVQKNTIPTNSFITLTLPNSGYTELRDSFGRVFYVLNNSKHANSEITAVISDDTVTAPPQGYGLDFNRSSMNLGSHYVGQVSQFTFEVLFNTLMTQGGTIYRHRLQGYSVYILNGVVYAQINNDINQAPLIRLGTVSTYNDDQWHYVAFTNNATHATLVVDDEVISAPTSVFEYGAGEAALGRDGDSAVAFFEGTMADFRLWTESKSIAQLQTLRNIRSIGFDSWKSDKLVACLPLASQTTGSVKDISQYNQNFFYVADDCTPIYPGDNTQYCDAVSTCVQKESYLSYCQAPVSTSAPVVSNCPADGSIASRVDSGGQWTEDGETKTIYDITVKNNGPCALTAVSIDIVLPSTCSISSSWNIAYNDQDDTASLTNFGPSLEAELSFSGAGCIVACPADATVAAPTVSVTSTVCASTCSASS